jgi:putative DNA methylase
LKAPHDEILKSTDGHPPPIYDPFCGGGSIPLEAQRLGLEAHGSDLNPVAVLITKTLVEIPPMFAGQPPVNPAAKKKMTGKGMWTGARGLADDVRYYGSGCETALNSASGIFTQTRSSRRMAVMPTRLSSLGCGPER